MLPLLFHSTLFSLFLLPFARSTLTSQSLIIRDTCPVIRSNFSDPAWISTPGIELWVAFASNNGSAGINVPIATSTDFQTWNLAYPVDALPDPGNWTSGNVLAPSVIQLADGTFVMYYSAELATNNSVRCIGAATSKSNDGEFKPLGQPIICPKGFGNAMDPSGFIYHEGSISEVYVIYKVDGNSQSTGDPCVHYNEPGRPTPIMVQKVSASDGYTLLGEPQEILAQIPSDGPAIGAPSMTRVSSNSTASGWLYVLFYSSGCSTEPDYTLSYAISADGILNGGQNYTRATAPLLAGCSDNGEMCSPGSPAVQLGAQKILFNASPAGGNEPRQLWVGEISIDAEAGTVSLSL